jgi:phage tail sheath protein FI
MAANYLHGVETIELNKGPVPISVVKSAVIGLVGIAPIGPVNTLTIVQNAQDAAQFGSELPGFNIPQALAAIFAQGAGTVLVVNTFSDTTNVAAVAAEEIVVSNVGKGKTSAAPVKDFVLKQTVSATTTTVATSKYTIDAFGNIVITDTALLTLVNASTASISADYKKLDAATVDAAQIIGTINGSTGARTGVKVFGLAFNLFGMRPKVLIAPGYSTLAAVGTELISAANAYRGVALLDAPAGTTVSAAITGRGPLGAIGLFATSSERAVLCFPMVRAYDAATDTIQNRPLSQFLAGVIAATDNSEGYWISPSNKEIKGIVGIERTITWAVNDAQTDANLLNEKGILTLAQGFGTGIRTWGNRSAAFPTVTAPKNFINVRRTADILHESLELAMLQFIDRPINQATIDSIRESVNAFMRTLIARGAIINGECTYDPAKNPTVSLAAGHITFDIAFMPPTPMERITFESFIDISYLAALA